MKRFNFVLGSVVLLSAATWAWAGDEKQGDTQTAAVTKKERGGDCVFSRTISNWDVLDNETLIIWAPTQKNPYLVKLWSPAFGLKHEFTLGFEDGNNDGQFCDYGQDKIVVRGPAGPERYNLRTVRRLDEAEAKALIASSKEKKKEQPAASMPEPADMKSDKKPEY